MTDTADILRYQQGVDVASPPDGFDQVTNPLNPSLRAASRFAHFSSDVYDLSPESHLSKLMKVLLGDAGTGQVQKRLLLARLQASIGGTNFFDLDAFYGAIFGAQRRTAEVLDVNPHIDMLTPDEWELALLRDGSYRSRASRLAAAIHLGATAGGIRAAAEALIGARCDVQEQWQISQDNPYANTWETLEAFTWDQLEAYTWDQLETTTTFSATVVEVPYNTIHVYPHKVLDPGSRWDVERALDRLKPAGSTVVVHTGVETLDEDVPAKAYADSEFWEVRSKVRNVKGFSDRLLLDGEEGEFLTLAKPPWSWYSGEAWTHLVNDPVALAYTTPGAPSVSQNIDVAAQMLTPQRYTAWNGQDITYLPTYALRPIQGIYSGRMVSDGVLAAHPYEGLRGSSGSTSTVGALTTDGIDVGTLMNRLSLPPNSKGVQYWTSPPRSYNDPRADVLEIRFDAAVTANQISFEHASFPCRIDVQAWTADGWVSVFKRSYRQSNPYGISGLLPRGETNPYHFGSGHWVSVREPIPTITSKTFRVVFTRQRGLGPVGRDGKPIPYPVGMRNFDIGYRLSSQSAVPNSDLSRPIVTTVNPVGLPVQHYVTQFGAERVLDEAETFWQCEPQPVSNTAVNLYLDLRDTRGNPQVVDRLWMDPVHTGPTFNLYWSDSEPVGDLSTTPSKEKPVVPTLNGSVTRFSDGDGGLVLHSGAPVHFDFDNSGLRFDPSRAWSFAAQMYTFFGSGQGSRFAILSAGSKEESVYEDVALVWDDSTGSISLRVGPSVGTITLSKPVASGAKVSIIAHHAEDGTISLSFIHPDGTVDDNTSASTYGDNEIVNTRNGRMATISNGTLGEFGLTVASQIGVTIPQGEFEMPTDEFEIAFWYLPTTSWAPGGNQTLIAIEGSSNNALRIQSMPSGNLRLSVSEDGTAWVENSRAVNGVDGTGMWLRVRWNTISNVAQIWKASGTPDTYPSDSAWSQAGTDFTLAIGSLFASTAGLTIGSTSATGTFGRVIVRKQLDGAASVDIDFAREAALDPDTVRVGCQWSAVPIRLVQASLSYGQIDPEDFGVVPDAFTRLPVVGGQDATTYGAILRLHPDYYGWAATDGFSWGWMGGALDLWDAVEWKPLVHNARVERGDIDFEAVRAKYLKAEFSNLVAQPYDALLTSQRQVRKIKPIRLPAYRGESTTRSALESALISLSGVNRYQDSPANTPPQDPSVNTVSPTTAITPIDPRSRFDLALNAGYSFGVLPWQPSHTMPINEQAGIHEYESMVVQSVNKVAFFIGLRSFKPKRTRPAMLSNTPQYFETFLDASGIDRSKLTMGVNPGHLYTPESATNALLPTPRTFESVTYYSRLPVTAVQFASHQSGPFQILPDDEFRDPSLPASDFSSVDGWHPSGDGIILWDTAASTVRVTRDPSEITGNFSPDTPIIHPPVSPVVASGYGESQTILYDTYGGITSPLIQTSPKGTIYVGARVTAIKDLSSPLLLRVYGSDESTVLLEHAFTPGKGVPTEVTVAYVVGSSPLDNAIQVRIEQAGPYADSWLVHSLSAFDDSVFWEVSNDGGATWVPVLYARNLLYGAIGFPTGGSALRWRVTCYRYNTIIDTVNVRPWYNERVGSG